MNDRQLKFGAAPVGVGGPGQQNTWLDPELPGDASVDINWYIERARQAEAALFDFIFVVDSQFITADSPPHYLNRLEPLTLLSALAVSTKSIGLAATITSSYTEPFHVARQLASLDLISHGRAGWNVVTSLDPGTAGNYGMAEHFDYSTRYSRALEHVTVAQGLWDSYEDDAFPRDKAAGVFFDPSPPAPAEPRRRALLGGRSAQRRELRPGPAGDLPGRRLRGGARPGGDGG
ncbi:MAG TPA: LLM class flavin-dependent oxidoreductase [Solirubrobacterales bacterium]